MLHWDYGLTEDVIIGEAKRQQPVWRCVQLHIGLQRAEINC
jgi:hypothetical protein